MTASSRARPASEGDPARDTSVVWRDRWNRDAARCREEAKRAQRYQRTLEALAEDFASGQLVLGRCAGERFLRRLEDSVRVLECVAAFTTAVAELLERVEKAESVLYDESGAPRRWGDFTRAPAEAALLRYAGIRFVVNIDDKDDA